MTSISHISQCLIDVDPRGARVPCTHAGQDRTRMICGNPTKAGVASAASSNSGLRLLNGTPGRDGVVRLVSKAKAARHGSPLPPRQEGERLDLEGLERKRPLHGGEEAAPCRDFLSRIGNDWWSSDWWSWKGGLEWELERSFWRRELTLHVVLRISLFVRAFRALSGGHPAEKCSCASE